MLFRNLTSGNVIEVKSREALELVSSSPYYVRVHRAPEKAPASPQPAPTAKVEETVAPAPRRAKRAAKSR